MRPGRQHRDVVGVPTLDTRHPERHEHDGDDDQADQDYGLLLPVTSDSWPTSAADSRCVFPHRMQVKIY